MGSKIGDDLLTTFLTYDDVLLRPGYSEILPSETSVASRFSSNIETKIPIVSSAMDTVTESAMAIEMARQGGIGVLHKNLSPKEQSEQIKVVKGASGEGSLCNMDKSGRLQVAAAVGVDEQARYDALVEEGVNALVVDTAHGHSKGVMETVKHLKRTYPKTDIVVGNVATPEACSALIDLGADGIKVGVGPGSICTTRVIAGVGVPQMSAILTCASVCSKAGVPIIADGGIRYSGDIVKALAGGAQITMIGSFFAGTDESPSEKITYQGKEYKSYRGMGSMGAMSLGSKDRYGQGAIQDSGKLVPEGIEGMVPYIGSLESNIYQLVGGVRSGMGYVGARTIEELREKAQFIKITAASLKEAHTHDVIPTKTAPNYFRST